MRWQREANANEQVATNSEKDTEVMLRDEKQHKRSKNNIIYR